MNKFNAQTNYEREARLFYKLMDKKHYISELLNDVMGQDNIHGIRKRMQDTDNQ